MQWKIAQAKQSFSQLVRSAGQEPQLIYNRDRLVAAVIAPEDLRDLQEYRDREHPKQTLAAATARVREVVLEDGEELEISPRTSRPNAFLEILDEIPD